MNKTKGAIVRSQESEYETDQERWKELSDSTWGEKNPKRTEIAGREIPDGSSVLDLGAGTMILKKHLKRNCIYQPCDLFFRGENCLVADLNAGEFPQGRAYDWVTLIGLFQFLTHPKEVLLKCREVASNMYITFSPRLKKDLSEAERRWRENEGWFNHYSFREYINVVQGAGWKVNKIGRIPANVILVAEKVDLVER